MLYSPNISDYLEELFYMFLLSALYFVCVKEKEEKAQNKNKLNVIIK